MPQVRRATTSVADRTVSWRRLRRADLWIHAVRKCGNGYCQNL